MNIDGPVVERRREGKEELFKFSQEDLSLISKKEDIMQSLSFNYTPSSLTP